MLLITAAVALLSASALDRRSAAVRAYIRLLGTCESDRQACFARGTCGVLRSAVSVKPVPETPKKGPK